MLIIYYKYIYIFYRESNSRQNALIGFIILLKSQCEIIKNLDSEDVQSTKNSKILIYEILGNVILYIF